MKSNEKIKIINGIRYRCRDLGCDDPDRARRNRLIVANKLFTTFYEQVESWFKHTPLHSSLPPWMPLGELPNVDKRDWREHGGGQGGMSEET